MDVTSLINLSAAECHSCLVGGGVLLHSRSSLIIILVCGTACLVSTTVMSVVCSGSVFSHHSIRLNFSSVNPVFIIFLCFGLTRRAIRAVLVRWLLVRDDGLRLQIALALSSSFPASRPRLADDALRSFDVLPAAPNKIRVRAGASRTSPDTWNQRVHE